jgi:hypothetical protein
VKCDLDSEQAAVNVADRATPISRSTRWPRMQTLQDSVPLRQTLRFRDDKAAHRPLPFAQTARNSFTSRTVAHSLGHLDTAHGLGLGARMEQTAQTRHGYTSRSAIGAPGASRAHRVRA